MHTSTQEASLFCLVLCKKRKKGKEHSRKNKNKTSRGFIYKRVCMCSKPKKQAEAVVRISTLPFTS